MDTIAEIAQQTFNFGKIPQFDTNLLKSVDWREGGLYPATNGPYSRLTAFVVMTERGSESAMFKDGQEHKYYALGAITGSDGKIRINGGHVIARYPNGDVVAIIVDRPSLYYTPRRTNTLEFLDGREPMDIGQTGSLEFPGGSIEPGESVQVGTIREFLEETGTDVRGTLLAIRRMDGTSLHLSELIFSMYYMVVEVPEGTTTPDYVDNDGGIKVVRLTFDELLHNRRRGLITTGSTLDMLRFLQDMTDPREVEESQRCGEVIIESVKII